MHMDRREIVRQYSFGEKWGKWRGLPKKKKLQADDLARERLEKALPRRFNVPLDFVEETLDPVEETEGASKEVFRDSSLRLCEGTGK